MKKPAEHTALNTVYQTDVIIAYTNIVAWRHTSNFN